MFVIPVLVMFCVVLCLVSFAQRCNGVVVAVSVGGAELSNSLHVNGNDCAFYIPPLPKRR